MSNELHGRFWIDKSKHNFLGRGRVELLRHINNTGSISKAAKAMRMSYKAAWDSVDAMNNLAERPLVKRVTGGKGGGGTRLTDYGKEIVDTFQILEEEYKRVLKNLTKRINSKDGHLRLLNSISMPISARNQLIGKVIHIDHGAVNTLITIELKGGHKLTAGITIDSLKELNIDNGSVVYALFKSNSLILSTDISLNLGVENRFEGRIERIEHGNINHDISILLDGGTRIYSQLSTDSLEKLGLKEGMAIYAFCKASQIMIAVY